MPGFSGLSTNLMRYENCIYPKCYRGSGAWCSCSSIRFVLGRYQVRIIVGLMGWSKMRLKIMMERNSGEQSDLYYIEQVTLKPQLEA